MTDQIQPSPSQEAEPQETNAKAGLPAPKRRRRRPFHRYRLFWFLLGCILLVMGIGVLNWALNNQDYQLRVASFMNRVFQTRLELEEVRFDLFWGEVKGKKLDVAVEKTGLKIALKEFKLSYSPLSLWLGRFKITGVYADEILLDTAQLLVEKKTGKKNKMPFFLKRIKLKEAAVKRFVWIQPENGLLTIDKVQLSSRFGSVVYKSPLSMEIESFQYRGPRHDLFVDRMNLEGFFIFDLSKPLIFDETRVNAKVDVTGALIAPHRTAKPWLTDPSWDEDLRPILARYYPAGIPEDHTYFFVWQAFFDIDKSLNTLMVNELSLAIGDAKLFGKGNWQKGLNNLNLRLHTDQPIPLSKMPLGQAKFRRAFEHFVFDLKLKGKFRSLEEQNLAMTLSATLKGNLVHPEAGDVDLDLAGRMENGILDSDLFQIKLDQGGITGKSRLVFKDLTTQTNFTAKDIDVQTVIRLFSSIQIPSLADGSGVVSGKITNPRIVMDLSSQDATYEFLHFGRAQGRLVIDNKNMQFKLQASGSDVGASELDMTVQDVFNPLVQVMSLNTRHQNVDIKKMLLADRMGGRISGTFNLKRISGKVAATGDFSAKDFLFFDQAVGDVDFKAVVREKHADIKPISIRLINPQKTVLSPTGLAFDFDDHGYTFSGTVIENLRVSGSFSKTNRNSVKLVFAPTRLDLDVFRSLLPLEPEQSLLTGKVELNYNLKDPYLSQMDGAISEFKLVSPDGALILQRPGGLGYRDRAYVFRNMDFTLGQGRVLLNGNIGLAKNSSLEVRGTVDFAPLVDFNPFISENEKPIAIDVTLKGDIFSPDVFGKVELKDDTIKFRKLVTEIENLNGLLRFDGKRITTEKLRFLYDDAPITMSGFVVSDFEKITAASLAIKGREVPLHFYEGLSLLSDVDLTLKGQGALTLEGKMNIVEGQYTRNFVVTNYFITPMETEGGEPTNTLAGLPLDTRYNLRIKNTGDLMIKNNMAELEMMIDADVHGTIENPELLGQLDFLGGQVHAFGITFDDARGFAHFSRERGVMPDVSVAAKKEIQGYNITAQIEGHAENLRLRMYASPALDHREILSLIFYGQTPDQITTARRRNFTQTAAISQLAGMLAGPLQEISGLDVLEVTARYDRPQETVQRLSVGKKLSDRFDITFTTDLGIDDPERALELRYQVLDNFYLIAAKDIVSRERFRFDVNLNFEAD